MRWKIVTLPKACEDYARITAFLSGFYPGTPRRFHEAYTKTLQRLKDNPYCAVFPNIPEYRRVLAGKYTLFYKIDDERREVHIHRILRGSWDVSQHLQEDEEQQLK